MSYWMVDGQKLTNEQYEEWERQKRLEEQRIQEESDRLSRELSQAVGGPGFAPRGFWDRRNRRHRA